MLSEPDVSTDAPLSLPGLYPRLPGSPLGCALDALAGAEVPVLFCGPTGSGCRWLARTLYALRHPTFAPIELDLEHCGGLVLDDALVMRQLCRRHDGVALIVNGLSRLSPSAQSALGDLVDEARIRVLASCRPGEPSTAASRSLRDRFLDIQVPPLRARVELEALVQAFMKQHAEWAGVPEPELDARILPLLSALGWPRRLDQLAAFARDAVERSDGAAATARVLAALTAGPARDHGVAGAGQAGAGQVVSLRHRRREV